MKRFAAILYLALAGPVFAAGPGDAVAAALADARRLSPEEALQTRYLTLYADPLVQRKESRQSVSFWANSLSREAEVLQPRFVAADLLAVRLIDYGWSATTWDRFALVDPYFTVRLLTPWPGGVWHGDGKQYAKNSFSTTTTASAPWLQAAAMAELYSRTGSKAPILRADWWLSQVAIQADRKVGYYDLLGVGKKRADFEKLVALDRAAATRLKKEVSAIVDRSIVALHNRHIYRYQTLTGAYWETRDAIKNTDGSNALRLLNGDYKHDAEEIYGSLPNGLFAFFLCDAAGARADTAPDAIASDGRSASTDRRVHVGLSCVRCHVEGVRPIDCWFRRTYAPPDRLDVLDPVRALRIRQLYTADLDRLVTRDQTDYAAALKLTNGLTPGDNAKVVASAWDRYAERPVTLDDAAREAGVTADELAAAIRGKAAPDPILFSLGKRQSVRREHWEEAFPLAMQLVTP